ncbi:MAG: Gfo/Idh/MocA family oxidoreductase, partial [Acidobacteria bacterium]|nr:Gfo/Idh/MocA family oxidoreductase [Acidobacteriota bacterium]
MNRRHFLAGAAALGGGSLLNASQNPGSASDRIRVAVIGMGWRGRDHMLTVPKVTGVEIVAFADPDQERLNERAAEFEKVTGKKPALYQDLRRVLEDKSIDAITVATPNHWHALATIWGCQAGKHVYVEKPLCHDFFQGQQMVAASRRFNRIVQGGTQRRSNVSIRKAMQALQQGIIGDVYMARCIHFQKREPIGFKQPEPVPATLDWDVWVGPG